MVHMDVICPRERADEKDAARDDDTIAAGECRDR